MRRGLLLLTAFAAIAATTLLLASPRWAGEFGAAPRPTELYDVYKDRMSKVRSLKEIMERLSVDRKLHRGLVSDHQLAAADAAGRRARTHEAKGLGSGLQEVSQRKGALFKASRDLRRQVARVKAEQGGSHHRDDSGFSSER
mmetsp:Transcript_40082/g.95057  ORF Transcript_40082/g.95057 Transcript_40082/m.95057 type:complete len:142 (-) Transcript_40082:260-685(-)